MPNRERENWAGQHISGKGCPCNPSLGIRHNSVTGAQAILTHQAFVEVLDDDTELGQLAIDSYRSGIARTFYGGVEGIDL